MAEPIVPEGVKKLRKKTNKVLLAYTVAWSLTAAIGVPKFFYAVGGGNPEMDRYHGIFYATQALKHSPEGQNELYKNAYSVPLSGRKFLDDIVGKNKDKMTIREVSDIIEAEKKRLEHTPLVRKYLIWNSAGSAILLGGFIGGGAIVFYEAIEERKRRKEWKDLINN